jgi:hypothetical protein
MYRWGETEEGSGMYQKCTVLRPTGLFHMRLAQESDAAPLPAAVLWKRAPVCLGRKKNWRARKAGRAARKRLLVGDIVFGNLLSGMRI